MRSPIHTYALSYIYVCIRLHVRTCISLSYLAEKLMQHLLYFTSSTTIDLAGRVTFRLPLSTLAPVNSFGATTSGFSKLL